MQQSYSGTVFKSELQPTAAVEIIKALLKQAPISETEISLYGECYYISLEPGKGLQWNKLPKSLAKPNLKVSAEKIDVNFVKKVCYAAI